MSPIRQRTNPGSLKCTSSSRKADRVVFNDLANTYSVFYHQIYGLLIDKLPPLSLRGLALVLDFVRHECPFILFIAIVDVILVNEIHGVLI